MQPAQLLFAGDFQRPPEYNYIRALCPNIRLVCCASLTKLPRVLNTTLIITSINWLETLSITDKKHLARATQACWQWLGICDEGVPNKTILQWLESGLNHLLPPELEQPLLRLLNRYRSVAEAGQMEVLLMAEAAAVTRRFDKLLQRQNIRCIAMTRNSPPGLPDQVSPDLIIAIDEFGVHQAQILKSQRGAAALPVIYLTTTSAAPATHSLTDSYAQIPRHLAETLLPETLQQFHQQLTEQRHDAQNKQYLHLFQRLTRALGEHALISTTDPGGKIIYTNRHFCDTCGYSQRDLLGKTHNTLHSGHHSSRFYDDLWQTIKSGNVWHGVICSRHKSGQHYWTSSLILPIRDNHGEVTSYICVGSDISSLQHNRSLLQTFEKQVSNGQKAQLTPWIMDIKSQNICICSPMPALEPAAFTQNNTPLNASDLLKLIVPDDRKRVNVALKRAISRQTLFETTFRITSADGSPRWLSAKGVPVSGPDGQPHHIQGVVEDINARKTAENMVSGSLLLFRQMFDNSDYCMAIADPAGKLVFINQAYTRVMGYRPEELIGRDCRELLSLDYATACRLITNILNNKQNWKGTTVRRRKDGSEFISLNLSGPLQDQSGSVSHLYITFTDITQECQHQQELAQAKAIAEEANQAKSEFITRMSHELRTPMNAVLGFARLLQSDATLSPTAQGDVREISKAGSHLLQLINDLLDLSRIESGQMQLMVEEVSLNDAIAECEALLQPRAQARQIRLQSQQRREYRIFTDRLRLKQVILNLLTNAIIYSPPGEEVTIRTGMSENGHIRVEFIDHGPGIPASLMDELFTPFQRLKQTSATVEGAGIGLTISQELIGLMGGEVGVNSQQGEGSAFWFELPVAPAADKPCIDDHHKD